jgi:hypothetical protein
MTSKLSEAVKLLFRHFGLFSAIVLTVWLPGNILLDVLAHFFPGSEDQHISTYIRSTMWFEAIFGPIYLGALVYALYEIKSGRPVTYWQAIRVGLHKWGPLFGARFIAGLFILFGLVAFIVPGIILAVRYALLEPVVVLEGKQLAVTSNPRARSTTLTQGKRSQIFGAALLFYILFLAVSVAAYLPLNLFETLNTLPGEIVLDCMMDIFYAVLQILLFLYYWEAISDEKRAVGSPEVSPPAAVCTSEAPA